MRILLPRKPRGAAPGGPAARARGLPLGAAAFGSSPDPQRRSPCKGQLPVWDESRAVARPHGTFPFWAFPFWAFPLGAFARGPRSVRAPPEGPPRSDLEHLGDTLGRRLRGGVRGRPGLAEPSARPAQPVAPVADTARIFDVVRRAESSVPGAERGSGSSEAPRRGGARERAPYESVTREDPPGWPRARGHACKTMARGGLVPRGAGATCSDAAAPKRRLGMPSSARDRGRSGNLFLPSPGWSSTILPTRPPRNPACRRAPGAACCGKAHGAALVFTPCGGLPAFFRPRAGRVATE